MNKYIIHTIIQLFVISICSNCNGQNENTYVFLDINDSLSMIETSINSIGEKQMAIKLYDEKLISEKEKHLKTSLFLPEGFSDYYYFEILDTTMAKVEKKTINKDYIINRKYYLDDINKTSDTILFLINIDKNKYGIYKAIHLKNE